MGNVFKYLSENKNKTFDELPINSIDMLVFAELSYINFEKKEYLKNNFSCINNFENDIIELTRNNLYIKKNKKLYNECINSNRYKDIMIGMVDSLVTNDIQYCAMTFKTEKKFFIVFRGTDTSLAGWREDFNMAVLDEIPSHLRGLTYTKTIMDLYSKEFYIIGHSKGGNVAAYVGFNLDRDYQNRINAIYDFDGPGFKDDLYSRENYLHIKDKYYKFVPQDDIVGVLLTHNNCAEIVKSNTVSIFQHDLYSWSINGLNFKILNKRTSISTILEESTDLWLNDMDLNRKYNIINTIFKVFDEAGIRDLDEFRKTPFKAIKNIILSYNLDLTMEERNLLRKISINLFTQSVKVAVGKFQNVLKITKGD